MKYYKLLDGIYAGKVVIINDEEHLEYCLGKEKLIETNIFANYLWPWDPEFEKFQEITKPEMENLLAEQKLQLENLLILAEQTATTAHKGQLDIGGHPYINHCEFVANNVQGLEQKIIAWLHDILEDTELTEEDLRLLGFTEPIIHSIKLLTRSNRMDYDKYLWRIKRDINAKEVKIADLIHNSDITRLGRDLKDKDKIRLRKYEKALAYLQDME